MSFPSAGVDAGRAPHLLASSERSQSAPTRRALLIGINKYIRTDEFPPLAGAIDDVNTMRDLLVSRFAFEPRNVRLLTDQAATRNGILDAVRRIVQESGEDDVVYIHYSGHGSQVKDLNGDEEDGLDETLVPNDGRTDGVPDITDDELAEILAPLKARAATIVLDSCYSGTFTRGAGLLSRAIPPDTRLELYRRQAVNSRSIVPRLDASHLILTGASSNEQALDALVDGRYYGLFTYSLSQVLSRSDPGATPSQIHQGVVAEMLRIGRELESKYGRPVKVPDPQFEGPPERMRQPVFPLLNSRDGQSPDQGPSESEDLLAGLNNPSSQIHLDVQIVSAAGNDSRAVRLVPSTATARYRVRKPGGDPRDHTNSLMLGIRSDEDCYLAIVDVDSENSARVLFPNEYGDRRGFLPGGLVRANRPVRIPDSLEENNRAGFHWDYTPPVGKDTVIVVCSTDASLALQIRQSLDSGGGTRSGRADKRDEVLGQVRMSIRQAMKTRGILIVPSQPEAAPSKPSGASEAAGAMSPETPQEQTGSPSVPGDWTAVQLRIEVGQ